VLVLLVPRRPPPSTLLVVARLVVQIRLVVSFAPWPMLVLVQIRFVLAAEPLPSLAVIVTVARAVLGILQMRVVAVRRVALGRYVVIRRVLALGADLVWMMVDGGVRQIMVARHGALCCCSSCCRCRCGCCGGGGGGGLNALG
jgi:hypothetical protein